LLALLELVLVLTLLTLPLVSHLDIIYLALLVLPFQPEPYLLPIQSPLLVIPTKIHHSI